MGVIVEQETLRGEMRFKELEDIEENGAGAGSGAGIAKGARALWACAANGVCNLLAEGAGARGADEGVSVEAKIDVDDDDDVVVVVVGAGVGRFVKALTGPT